jgi:hypothetical protein
LLAVMRAKPDASLRRPHSARAATADVHRRLAQASRGSGARRASDEGRV